jgi:ketosteroid isomerase-like protein
MKRAVAVLFVVFCQAIGGVASAGEMSAPSGAFAEAAATVDAFHNSLAKGDVTAAQALLDDQVLVYEQGHVERSKAEYASHHLASDAQFSAATKRTQTARGGAVFGDIAYVTSEGRVAGTFNGRPIDLVTLETMALRRDGDAWRIVHIHWSSRAAK